MANKLNKKLIEKVIKRLEERPETYYQEDWFRFVDEDVAKRMGRPAPACGAVACLAGETIICSARSVTQGIKKLERIMNNTSTTGPVTVATKLMGIENSRYYLFSATAGSWPKPFSTQFRKAKDYKGEARAAVNLLRAILRTDGKILEGN